MADALHAEVQQPLRHLADWPVDGGESGPGTAGLGGYTPRTEGTTWSGPTPAETLSPIPLVLFIEQAIEQKDSGLEFMGRSLEVGGMDGYRYETCWGG